MVTPVFIKVGYRVTPRMKEAGVTCLLFLFSFIAGIEELVIRSRDQESARGVAISPHALGWLGATTAPTEWKL